MKRKEKLKLLQNWQQCYDNNEALLKTLIPIFGCIVESTINKQLWNCFDELTDTTEKLLGSDYNWLDWYCWENDMGAKGLDAGYDRNLKPIKTLNDLLDLIEKL
jgi:hypothetical protein